MNILFAILVMAATTYLIRMLPLTLMRKKIRSRFFRDLLYYIPYAVLASMTIPAIFFATGSFVTAAIGTAVAFVLAFLDMPLIVVALAAAGAAFAAGFLPFLN